MKMPFLIWLLLAWVLRSVILFVGWNYVVAPLCHWGHMVPWQAALGAGCIMLARVTVSAKENV
jgi:hypothetical protein